MCTAKPRWRGPGEETAYRRRLPIILTQRRQSAPNRPPRPLRTRTRVYDPLGSYKVDQRAPRSYHATMASRSRRIGRSSSGARAIAIAMCYGRGRPREENGNVRACISRMRDILIPVNAAVCAWITITRGITCRAARQRERLTNE